MALLDPIPYRIIGKIVDNSNNPLSGATIISSKGDTTTSEVNGDFELNGLREETETFSIIISKILLLLISENVLNPPPNLFDFPPAKITKITFSKLIFNSFLSR